MKYIKLPKSKRNQNNQVSPYLEEIYEPVISRTELEKMKLHNMKVKKQKENDILKAEKQQALNELAVNINAQSKSDLNIQGFFF